MIVTYRPTGTDRFTSVTEHCSVETWSGPVFSPGQGERTPPLNASESQTQFPGGSRQYIHCPGAWFTSGHDQLHEGHDQLHEETRSYVR